MSNNRKSFAPFNSASRLAIALALIAFALLSTLMLVTNNAAAQTPSDDVSDIDPTPVQTVIATIEPTPVPLKSDLGDAPDSSNHAGVSMLAYPGVFAEFPTVFDTSTGTPNGPKHRNNQLRYVLGMTISAEREADQGFDADPTNNIRPLIDRANLDRADDGLQTLAIRHCRVTQVQIEVTNFSNQTRRTYVNMHADWNRSGAWGDASPTCPNGTTVSEWPVSNRIYNAPPGTSTLTVPIVGFHPNASRYWARVTLSNAPAPDADGRGLSNDAGDARQYRFGETEDYILPSILPDIEPTIVPTD